MVTLINNNIDSVGEWEELAINKLSEKLSNRQLQINYLCDLSIHASLFDTVINIGDLQSIIDTIQNNHIDFKIVERSHSNSLVISDEEVIMGIRDESSKCVRGLKFKSKDLVTHFRQEYDIIQENAKDGITKIQDSLDRRT